VHLVACSRVHISGTRSKEIRCRREGRASLRGGQSEEGGLNWPSRQHDKKAAETAKKQEGGRKGLLANNAREIKGVVKKRVSWTFRLVDELKQNKPTEITPEGDSIRGIESGLKGGDLAAEMHVRRGSTQKIGKVCRRR